RCQEGRVPNDAPQGPQAVSPTDLLPLLIGSGEVRDTDLVDAPRPSSHLGRDLRLEAKAVFVELDAAKHLTPEDLVTRLHVRQVEIRRHVGDRGEELVSYAVPEVEHSVRLRRVEARTVDDVRLVLDERGEEGVVLGWV